MNKYKLPLVDYHNDEQEVDLIFLDEIAGETHDVKWNKRRFNPDSRQWEDDPEKVKQVEGWSEQYLGVPLDKIGSVMDKEFTVYSYPTFDSMWEVASKFSKAMKGQIIQAEIDHVEATPTAIVIWYRYKGDLYLSRMRHERVLGDRTYTDGTKKNKRYAEFNEKYGVTVDEAVDGALNGRVINVLIKVFGNSAFGEIQSIVMPL